MTYRHVGTSLLLAVAIAGHGSGTARAATPLTPEFRVNTFSSGHQYRSRMSMSPTGEFVVTWTGTNADGNGFGIMAQRFDSVGAAVGAEFVVNSYTTGDQQFSAASINEAGEFVVVWRTSYEDGDFTGIAARRFDETGAPQGAAFRVNDYTTSGQSAPDVAVGPRGGFFVVWESNGQDGSYRGIFARRHDDTGAPQADEFQVNLVTSGEQFGPRIVIVQPSDLVVLWNSGGGVAGRRLGSSGAVGAEFVIDTGAATPSLVPTGDGNFLAAWQAADGDASGIFARRFDLVGDPVGAEFQVNAYTSGAQFDAEVAGNGDDFVVVWSSFNHDGNNEGVFARQLDAAGPSGAEFQVNQYTTGPQSAPSVAMGSGDSFVVVWDSVQILGATDVFARRYSVLELPTLTPTSSPTITSTPTVTNTPSSAPTITNTPSTVAPLIPTLSKTGVAIMVFVLLGVGAIFLARQRS